MRSQEPVDELDESHPERLERLVPLPIPVGVRDDDDAARGHRANVGAGLRAATPDRCSPRRVPRATAWRSRSRRDGRASPGSFAPTATYELCARALAPARGPPARRRARRGGPRRVGRPDVRGRRGRRRGVRAAPRGHEGLQVLSSAARRELRTRTRGVVRRLGDRGGVSPRDRRARPVTRRSARGDAGDRRAPSRSGRAHRRRTGRLRHAARRRRRSEARRARRCTRWSTADRTVRLRRRRLDAREGRARRVACRRSLDKHPAYGFDEHKGYGTTATREAIASHGLS